MKCITCGTELNVLNISQEHIIPNSLGGRLKSSTVLCKLCNSKFGETIDKALSDNLGKYMTLFGFKRDRGINQKVELKTKSGEKLHLYDNRLERSKPSIQNFNEDGKEWYQIIARSDKEAYKMLKGIYNKHKLDMSEINDKVQNADRKKEYLGEKVNLSLDFGGQKFFRAIGKIALCYYAMGNYDTSGTQGLVDYINGDSVESNHLVTMYYDDKNISNWKNDGVFHYIGLSSNKKWIFAYIELFKAYKFIVRIKKNNNNINLKDSYYQWLSDDSYPEKYLVPRIDNLEVALTKDIFDYLEEIQRELNCLLKIAYKNREKREYSRFVEEIVREVSEENNDQEYFTEDMFNEIANRVAREYVKMKYR